jgi:antitoxin ParD1/3/4
MWNNRIMPTKNVNLSEQQTKFIKQTVRTGRFRNASEVVRAGLRLLEQNERQDKLKLAALRRLVKEGFDELDRGEYEVVAPGQLDAFMGRIDAKVRAGTRR